MGKISPFKLGTSGDIGTKEEEYIMKKLIGIIIILVIILVGMVIYKNNVIKTNHVSLEEIEKIENYIGQIYMWKEITKEALPCFEDINQADDRWIWEVVKKNLEEYEFSYEQVQQKAKELFGEAFKKEFPKEGTEYLMYDELSNLYYAVGVDLDQQEDVFLLNKIELVENGYEIEIIEYLEDYSQETEEKQIKIRNIEGEEIGEVSSNNEIEAKELVRNKSEQLSKKKIWLKQEDGKLQVTKVERK